MVEWNHTAHFAGGCASGEYRPLARGVRLMIARIGDIAPSITANAHDGRVIDTSSAAAPRVIYFYPRSGTPVCTRQACSFQERLDGFAALNVEVIGISADTPDIQRAFADKYDLQFALLSDCDGRLSQAFDVGRALGVLANRVTFVIDRQNRIVLRYQAQLAAGRHVERALAALESL